MTDEAQMVPYSPLAGERLISRAELRHFVNASDMALWRWVRAGKFPNPVYIGARRYWLATSIEQWLAERHRPREGGARIESTV